MKTPEQVLRLIRRTLSLALALSLLLSSQAFAADPKPLVIVSVPEQAFFVKRLAGNLVEVQTIIPPGATAETYEPGLAQIQKLQTGALFIQLGHPLLYLELAWLENLKKISPKLLVVSAVDGASVDAEDPHVWLSAKIAHTMAKNSAEGLKRILPQEHAAIIDSQLLRLDAEIKEVNASLNELFSDSRGKAFLVFHPAWGYFAKEYGLTQLAIETEGKMPTPGGLARVIAEAKRQKIKTVFIHPGHSEESAEVVAEELGAKIVAINPLGENWVETMLREGAAIHTGLGQ